MIICAGMLWPCLLTAQKGALYKAEVGQRLNEVITFEDMYVYPEFTPGNVYYSQGVVNPAYLNYNLVISGIEFIDEFRDTLSIANTDQIDSLTIGEDTYYIFEGQYYRMLTKGERVTLFNKRSITFRNASQSSTTSSSKNYAGVTYGNRFQENNFRFETDMVFWFDSEYILRKQDGETIPMRKGKVLSAFPSQRSDIKSFLKSEDIDLDEESDLKKLVDFINSN